MSSLNRRELLRAAGAGAAALAFVPSITLADQGVSGYTLPKLPYAYDALEPSIDAETMHLHHDAHHKAYVEKLNQAVAKYPDLAGKPVAELLRGVDRIPEEIRSAVRNNGGGHANHTMFWEIMGPAAGGQPSGALAKSIQETFGGFEPFQQKITKVALDRFGSGWAWLVLAGGKLDVYSTGNQDSPYMTGHRPLLGIDVWEHAYYLKYKNKRADYVKAWWNVVNWDRIAERYDRALRASQD